MNQPTRKYVATSCGGCSTVFTIFCDFVWCICSIVFTIFCDFVWCTCSTVFTIFCDFVWCMFYCVYNILWPRGVQIILQCLQYFVTSCGVYVLLCLQYFVTSCGVHVLLCLQYLVTSCGVCSTVFTIFCDLAWCKLFYSVYNILWPHVVYILLRVYQ